ncbi:hypothetical protein TNCV_1498171 [Trichonephila clavipes]|nr:hypothetical protein TNCV_1498171 [Trichonephila clavipes]
MVDNETDGAVHVSRMMCQSFGLFDCRRIPGPGCYGLLLHRGPGPQEVLRRPPHTLEVDIRKTLSQGSLFEERNRLPKFCL